MQAGKFRAIALVIALAALGCFAPEGKASVAGAGVPATDAPGFAHPYGVLISCDSSQANRFAQYQTLVIDAAYFTAEEIAALKAAGHTVLTYLNVGSLESFRPYYARFEDRTLAAYEHWDEERWMDVADTQWQDFLTGTLAAEYRNGGVDGFFVDNCDVYDLYPTDATFDGLPLILKKLRKTGAEVIVNGGDGYVTEYANRFNRLDEILTGVNQESVFSSINFERGTFARAAREDHLWFTRYVERVAAFGAKVYLLEYTKQPALIREIAAYCKRNGFIWYISDSIELD